MNISAGSAQSAKRYMRLEFLNAIARSAKRNRQDVIVFDTVRAGCDDYEFKCIKCGFTKQFTSKDDKFLKSTSSPNQILNEVKA